MDIDKHYASLKLFSILIFTLYRKLSRLEFENKKDSIEYKNTIKLINKMKIEEKSYYDKLSEIGDEKFILGFSVCAQKDAFGEVKSDKTLYSPQTLFSPKLSTDKIVIMRIATKIIDIFRHKYHKTDNAVLNVYDTYMPLRDKYFLDVLSNQIDDDEYLNWRKTLIKTKYDYAFVFDKDISELKEYDETIEDNENIELFVGLGTLFEYKDKYLSLNNLTLLDPNNRKKLIMDINFIRANALCVPVEYLEALKFMIVDSCDDLTDGKKFFLNLLDITIDDKNQFDEEDIPFKRKF